MLKFIKNMYAVHFCKIIKTFFKLDKQSIGPPFTPSHIKIHNPIVTPITNYWQYFICIPKWNKMKTNYSKLHFSL